MVAKKHRNCKKGYGCGNACISVKYVCRKSFVEAVSVSIDGMRTVIRGKIKQEKESKPKSDGKLAKDIDNTGTYINDKIAKGDLGSARTELTNLKHRIAASKDPDKAELQKKVDELESKFKKADDEFKAKAKKARDVELKAAEEQRAKRKAERAAEEAAQAKAKKDAEEAETKKKETEAKAKEEAEAKAKRDAELRRMAEVDAKREAKALKAKQKVFEDRAAEVDDAIKKDDPDLAQDRIDDLRKVIDRDSKLTKEYKDSLRKKLDAKEESLKESKKIIAAKAKAERKVARDKKAKALTLELEALRQAKDTDMDKGLDFFKKKVDDDDALTPAQKKRLKTKADTLVDKERKAREVRKAPKKIDDPSKDPKIIDNEEKLIKDDKLFEPHYRSLARRDPDDVESIRGALAAQAAVVQSEVKFPEYGDKNYGDKIGPAQDKEDLANDLLNASNAANPMGYLRTRRAERMIRKKLWNEFDSDKRDEIEADLEFIADKSRARYYGEPDTPRTLKAKTTVGEVDAVVPKKLPKGSTDGPAPKEFKALMDEGDVLMQVNPKGLLGIIKDGEFKNGFQRNTAQKRTRDYLDIRKDTEKEVMNINKNTPADKRPVYAFVENPDRALNGMAAASHYGDIQIKFKNSVKKKGTVTMGDSMDDADQSGAEKATPMTDPARPAGYVNGNNKKATEFERSTPWGSSKISYMEVQLHGKITTADIEEVRIPRGIYADSQIKEMEAAGIKVRLLPPTLK